MVVENDTQEEESSDSDSPSEDEEPEDDGDNKVGDEQGFEVRRVKAMRGKGNKVQYLVAWKGLDPGTGEKYCDSWEPASGLKASEWAAEQFKNKIANEIPIKKRASSSCASSSSSGAT